MTSTAPGKLIIVSGPSGAGKTTILDRVFARRPGPLRASVSATTRSPRPGEVDGEDYHFISREEFARRRAAGDFLECFEVYSRGDWYGTLREEVAPRLAAGDWVVLEVDVQGTLAVLRRYPDAITIFVRPSSIEELERRLRSRGTETEDAIQRRLEVARKELAAAHDYQHHVVNDDMDRAVQDICEILVANEEGCEMHDMLREEGIVNKVGGRFKLSTLIQKRMVALNSGSRPLVDMPTDDKMAIVIQEILQDKIYLDMSQNVRVGKPTEQAGPPEFDLSAL